MSMRFSDGLLLKTRRSLTITKTSCVGTRGQRRGPGNSDSVIRGSLASPKPPGGGELEERGDEENTTESQSDG